MWRRAPTSTSSRPRSRRRLRQLPGRRFQRTLPASPERVICVATDIAARARTPSNRLLRTFRRRETREAMTMLEHLEELRRVLAISLGAWLGCNAGWRAAVRIGASRPHHPIGLPAPGPALFQ